MQLLNANLMVLFLKLQADNSKNKKNKENIGYIFVSYQV